MTQGRMIQDFINVNANKQEMCGKHDQAAIVAFGGNRHNISGTPLMLECDDCYNAKILLPGNGDRLYDCIVQASLDC